MTIIVRLMSKKLSMSMRVDRHSENKFTVPPRMPMTWIPDCRVRRCFGCNIDFSLLRRKHHCRSCGRIFCHSCCSYRVAPTTYGERTSASQRMCAPCAENARLSKETEWLVIALSVMPVGMRELFDLRVLDKKWNFATNCLISYFRGLQYKLSTHKYSRLEKNFLWTHFKEFQGHVPWQIHAIISCKDKADWHKKLAAPNFVTKRTCRSMLCSRTCQPIMSISDIIRLGITGTLKAEPLQNWVIVSWKHIQENVHIKMMFWWVFLACKYEKLFKHGLLKMAVLSIDLAYSVWFECELQKSPQTFKLLQRVQKNIRVSNSIKTDIIKSKKLCELLIKIGRSPSRHRVTMFFTTYGATRLPWAPKYIVTDILNFKRLNSASSPMRCTLLLLGGHCVQILIKNEDVRTDRLAMNISYWIANLTAGIVMPIYKVFPLSLSVGIVEMIPETTTLYDIRKTSTLLNFIMTNCPELKTKTLRERMISSSAGACLLAFTMGLGDRHLENILVTKTGYLVHVDFGYVLGDDPKHAATPMRITEDMVDAMGGKNSKTYESFIDRTQKGYATMRLHADFWYHLLASEYYIFHDHSRHTQRIREHVLDRFVPGEWQSEASLHIKTVVRSASQTTWMQKFSDFTHSASVSLDEILRAQRDF